MNAPARLSIEAEPLASLEDFAECARDFAWYWRCGWLEKAEAVDLAQRHAELWGIVEIFGQDEAQTLVARAFAAVAEITEAPPIVPGAPPAYRTPQATVDAFLYLTRVADVDRLTRWLADHPRDAAFLHKLWKRKCTAAAT